jgi:DNA-binding transcriptional LysR family regulator
MLNLHHLELFYHVARNGGIAPAVRAMPYGIQQPAISAQVIALEEHLGVTLFRRRPFELTAGGRELYEFLEPFFGGLDELEGRLRGGILRPLRVGSSQTVLRDHLPGILHALREQYPELPLKLKAGYQQELERQLQNGDVDLVVTVIDRTVASGLKSEILIELNLALLVPRSRRSLSVAELLEADRMDEPLIGMRSDEAVSRVFQQELTRRGVTWPVSIEVGTLELVGTYVAQGFGLGVGVEVPGTPPPNGVRLVRLEGFPRLQVGVLWVERLSPTAERLVDLLRAAAQRLQSAVMTGD